MQYEGYGATSCNWCTWNYLQRLAKGAGGVRYHPNYNFFFLGRTDCLEESCRPEETCCH